ncbi:response regulator transcription factor [Deinococcus ruber]|uniref:DNA-binding response regulator n=1 Tax=Deinococcus ruber TaxID=1848197 RepID=A0A918FIE5_9DEIO|nr:response regulator transcription factor [Deinococcus ruber]GGR39999.1 hypothetical protein GCM10008957_55790 [Deinococcus ruber]
MTTPHLLIIDQDLLLVAQLQATLEDIGYRVRVATSLMQGLTLARRHFPTLVVVALELPDGSGRDVVTRLRASSTAVPIIVLTNREEVEDQWSLVHLGATECVSKPVLVRALVARIQGYLRQPQGHDTLSYGELRVFPDQQLVTFEGNALNLTDTECRILAFLLRERGRIVSRAEIAHALWVDHDGSERSNVIDVHVTHLRAKLRAVQLYGMIRTVRSVGYVIRQEAPHAQ